MSYFDDEPPSEERNRRKSRRRPAHVRAWADPGGVAPVVDCLIVDISDEGASVAPIVGSDLPDAFRLQLDASRVVGDANVVWRRGRAVGVTLTKRKKA